MNFSSLSQSQYRTDRLNFIAQIEGAKSLCQSMTIAWRKEPEPLKVVRGNDYSSSEI